MASWKAKLQAEEEWALERLSRLLRDEFAVEQQQSGWVLVTKALDPFDAASDAHKAANALIDRINKLSLLVDPEFPTVRVDKLIRVDDDGKETGYVPASVVFQSKSHIFADLTVIDRRTGQPKPSCSLLQTLLRKGEVAAPVLEALGHIQRQPNGIGYNLAWEVFAALGGGEARAVREGWSTAEEIARFKASIQADRHRRSVNHPHPMSRSEQGAFILQMLRRWVTA